MSKDNRIAPGQVQALRHSTIAPRNRSTKGKMSWTTARDRRRWAKANSETLVVRSASPQELEALRATPTGFRLLD